ncbi:MAG: patatin-like phospholipase family protein [Gammaproteobacteria bacterium]|jgi:NTE family protein|nr:patatin-like phospholipase family protein [Gammaproteobacteria bacterium]
MDTEHTVGLALGSGSSRGWSHIGILKALAELGITPSIICGTSIGSLVGASYVSGKIAKLEQWACSLTKFETARFFEINTSLSGFVNTDRLHYFLNENVASDSALIEDLEKVYAAVSTNLETGREIWLMKGSLMQAVWASMSLPGLFPAIRNNNRWLVDGGLVNPVPVSVCRALGADIVIAVNLNGDIVGKHLGKSKKGKKPTDGVGGKLTDLVRDYTSSLFPTSKSSEQPPSLLDAIAGSVNITQDRITRSRMAGDPPDIVLAPKLSHIGLLEFYRASEAIREGEGCVQRMKPEIEHVLGSLA